MKIWLPDDSVPITVDTSDTDDERCVTYAQRFQLTLQPLKKERGFNNEKEQEK